MEKTKKLVNPVKVITGKKYSLVIRQCLGSQSHRRRYNTKILDLAYYSLKVTL